MADCRCRVDVAQAVGFRRWYGFCTLRDIGSSYRRQAMLKFLGGTIGVIFLIGLIVVILLLMLIF